MRSLFLRIFLSFWAAQVLFLVLAILVTIAMRPARHGIESQGPQILAEAVNAYQSGGEHGVHDYLEELLHSQHVRAFVFDPSGHELSGRQVPPWIEDTRQGVPPHGGSSHGGFPHHHGWMDSLLPDRILRQALTLDGKRYTLVLELPPGPRVFFGPHEIPGLGIGIVERCFARIAISAGPPERGAGAGAAAGCFRSQPGSCAGTRKFAEPDRTGG